MRLDIYYNIYIYKLKFQTNFAYSFDKNNWTY